MQQAKCAMKVDKWGLLNGIILYYFQILVIYFTHLGVLGIIQQIALQTKVSTTPALKRPGVLQQESLLDDGHLEGEDSCGGNA